MRRTRADARGPCALAARRGSVATEAALAVSGFLFVATAAYCAILGTTADGRVGQALERAGRIAALSGVAADLLGVDQVSGALEDVLSGEDLAGAGSALGGALGGTADLAASLLSGAAMPSLLDRCFEADPETGDVASRLIEGVGPGRWSTTCEVRLAEDRMTLVVRYGIATPFGTLPRRRSFSVALWSQGDGSADPRDRTSVWSLGNLARGQAIRIRFGANLPFGYPVLAAFRDGRATAIHSMDLSPYGWQDVAEAGEALASWIRDLASFDGTPTPWGADGVDIAPGAIRSRRLLLVVPSNADDARYAPLLAAATEEAALLGVRLDVVRYQERPPPVAGE